MQLSYSSPLIARYKPSSSWLLVSVCSLIDLYVFLADTVASCSAVLSKVLITGPNTAVQICYSSLSLYTACPDQPSSGRFRIYFFYIIFIIFVLIFVYIMYLMMADLESGNMLQ